MTSLYDKSFQLLSHHFPFLKWKRGWVKTPEFLGHSALLQTPLSPETGAGSLVPLCWEKQELSSQLAPCAEHLFPQQA